MRPGTDVEQVESPTPRQVLTDTGTGFFYAPAEKGSSDAPMLFTSLDRAKRRLGGRVNYSSLLAALEWYFLIGGSRAYVSRVVGEDAARAGLSLNNATAAATLRFEALDVGEYGNGYRIQVTVDGATFVVILSHVTDGELERSPALADTTAAIEWAERSSAHIRGVELAGAGNPVAIAATPLTGGTDDHAAIDDAAWKAGGARFGRGLGPGQLAAPGLTTTQGWVDLLSLAAAGNRVPVLDGPNTADKAATKAAVAALRAAVADSKDLRPAGLWSNWLSMPGPAIGTRISIPPSAVQAGLIARSDRTNSPNVPAAGENGKLPSVVDLAVEYDDATVEELSELGINSFHTVQGDVRSYGYRSLALKDDDPNWWQFSHARLFMAIVARADVVAERYVFSQIDPQRRKLAQFEGDLVAEAVMPFYTAGSLWGSSPDEAFRVDATSVAANPDDQLAEGIVRGLIFVRVSPFAEWVRLEVTKQPITDPIPA